jgi:hypothetical protein
MEVEKPGSDEFNPEERVTREETGRKEHQSELAA